AAGQVGTGRGTVAVGHGRMLRPQGRTARGIQPTLPWRDLGSACAKSVRWWPATSGFARIPSSTAASASASSTGRSTIGLQVAGLEALLEPVEGAHARQREVPFAAAIDQHAAVERVDDAHQLGLETVV